MQHSHKTMQYRGLAHEIVNLHTCHVKLSALHLHIFQFDVILVLCHSIPLGITLNVRQSILLALYTQKRDVPF